MASPPKIAIVKFNNGRGALLCNTCLTIIKYGFDHEDTYHQCTECEERSGYGGPDDLQTHTP